MHRRIHEGGSIPNGCFITLTYNDENLPEDGQVDVKHWQNFAKKLRRRHGPFRFLHCGEYGSKTRRPHYHALLFGIDFHRDRTVFSSKPDNTIWLSEELSDAWSHKGYCSLSPLNFATAKYVAGYVAKKLRRTDFWHLTDVYGSLPVPIETAKPEYITMSRRPGLGESWFKQYWASVYPMDRVIIDGKSFRPPKYYDDLLKRDHPIIHERVLAQRTEWAENQGPTSDLELDARYQNFQSRAKRGNQRDKIQ